MASLKNNGFDAIHEGEPKKIIIVAGPSFGSAVGFMLLGAALGVAATVAIQRKRNTHTPEQPKLFDEEDSESPGQRVSRLAGRIGVLASRTRDALGSLSESLTPIVQSAIEEARAAAAETTQELEKELHEETAHS